MLEFDPPESHAEVIADMITGNKIIRAKLITRPVMVRIPVDDLLTIDAMADLAGGKSRNQIICHLLTAGIESVVNILSVNEENFTTFHNKRNELRSATLNNPDNQSEDLKSC